ncbi:MAG TPA: diguanylate cyclase [Rectinemataceae bacterium]|nr:diguanylate cyclase [Rectinemataceae bacterium]
MDCPEEPADILAGITEPEQRTAAAAEWLFTEFRRCPAVARRLIEVQLPEAERSGDVRGATWLRFYAGWLRLDDDDYETARSMFESVRAGFEALGDTVGLCRTYNALGAAQVSVGAYDLSLDYYRRCLETAEELGRTDLAGGALVNIADCLWELEEYEEAREAIERSYREFTLSPHNEPLRDIVAGKTYRALGLGREAEEHLRAAITGSQGVSMQVVDARRVLAELYLDQQRLDDAESAIEGCVELAEAKGDRLPEASCRIVRARLALARGRPGALEDAESALRTAREIGARRLEADAQRIHAETHRAAGDYAAALEAFELHHQLKESLKNERTRLLIRSLREEQSRREAGLYRAQLERISTLSEIGKGVTSSLDLEMIAEALRAGIRRLMTVSSIVLDAIGDPPESRVLETIPAVKGAPTDGTAIVGAAGGGCSETPCPPPELDPFRRRALETRAEIHIRDALEEWPDWAGIRDAAPGGAPGLAPGAAPGGTWRSLVQLPLLVGDRVVGLLGLRSEIPGAFGPEQIEALRIIGSYAAIAIENHGLFRKVQELASQDPLTGLRNRRSIMSALGDEYRQFRRYGRPVAVVMLDADRFKSVNDRHGHDAGDAALVYLAAVLRREARSSDLIGRYGGEEFLLVLPDSTLDGALVCAERFRSALADSPLQLPDGRGLKLTASFGVSLFRSEDEGPEAALGRADRALYRAKSEGRNRVSAEG